jgi:hypothetical protein
MIRVRPASDATSAENSVPHFFSDEAASNFLVPREGVKAIAAVLGNNEMTNTDHNNGGLNKMSNFVVGMGTSFGLAAPNGNLLQKVF